MGDIRMTKGQIMSLKVTSIVEARKNYPKDNGVIYIHDIFLEDANGNKSRKEYKSPLPTIPKDIFIQGIYQDIRCTFADDRGDTIEPYDAEYKPVSPLRQAAAQQLPPASTQPIRTALPHPTSETTYVPPKSKQDLESAKNFTFCMAWAKDLKVAEIGKRKAGATITDDDINHIIEMATKLHGGIVDFQEMQ